MAKGNPQTWFRDAVLSGVQALWSLSLPGSPPEETIDKTADVWVAALWSDAVAWERDADLQRIHTAFERLVRDADRWPSPAVWRRHLPSRRPKAALPAPQMSPERRAENSRRLREALARVIKSA